MTELTPSVRTDEITLLLRKGAEGDAHADMALVECLWSELHAIAAAQLRNERAGHTLQPTALVHEAWLRLIDTTALRAGDRERFLSLAARAIRRVLVDHARKRNAARRGGGEWERVPLHPDLASDEGRDVDLAELGDLLDELAENDPRMCQVVELRFFGGMTIEEAAEVLGVSDRTVQNDWRLARAWLKGQFARSRSK
jgi:RNA polymerase sigma-70 factor (ECF subfamily)